MANEDLKFVPGASSSQKEEQKHSSNASVPYFQKYPWKLMAGGILALFVYAGSLFLIEYAVLTRPIQTLEQKKETLQANNSEVLPQTSDSVAIFLASLKTLSNEDSEVASYLQILQEQSGLRPEVSTLNFIGSQKELKVRAMASSPEAVSQQVQNLRSIESIVSAEATNIQKIKEGGQRFQLSVTFR